MKLMRRALCIITAILLMAGTASASPAVLTEVATSFSVSSSLTLEGEAGCVIDANTGNVLYSQNADEILYPASITKLMTALLVLENCELDEVVTFSYDAVNSIEWDSSNIGALVGEEMTVEQCLYALLLESANEVANALAEHVAGSMEDFAEMMNERAAELGCTNTHFTNASGLHDDDHYTTAYDMCLILMALKDNETFITISSADSYTIPPTNMYSSSRYLEQLNKLFYASAYTYEYAVAGKLGYTPEAGNTLATYAVKDDTELICVVLLTDWTHYSDTIAMLDYCFENYTGYDLTGTYLADEILDLASEASGVSTEYLSLSSDNIVLIPAGADLADVTVTYSGRADNVITVTYTYGNVTVGTGTITVNVPETEAETDAAASSDLSAETGTGSSDSLRMFIYIDVIAAAVILLVIFLIVRRRRRRRRRKRNSRRR